MKTPAEKALALCYAIEELPASEQQTKCSVLASELAQELRASNPLLGELATLGEYLKECEQQDITEFRLVLQGNGHGYVHPLGKNGRTLDFCVIEKSIYTKSITE